MRFFAGLIILLIAAGFSPARAQQSADDQYLYIYAQIQQADSLAGSGHAQQALAGYAAAQAELEKFQKIYPDWKPNIVKFRLKYLAGKIADATAQLPPPVADAPAPPADAPAPPATVTNVPPGRTASQPGSELAALRSQVQQLQADNTTLAAKLTEALSVQPATIDSRELVRAHQQIQSLMKENNLLKASLSQGARQTNIVTVAADAAALKEIQEALISANQKLAVQTDRADRLELENRALQSRVQMLLASPDSLEALRAENALLRKQIDGLKLAAANNPNVTRMEDDVKQARLQVAAFKSQNLIWQLEKAALENRLRKSQAAATAPPLQPKLAKAEARLLELAQERDDLQARLLDANRRLAASKDSSSGQPVGELTEEIKTLRARLAVYEAKPVPYTVEELALFRADAPGVAPVAREKAPVEASTGSATLVAQAQSFFASRQFERAETNYLEILKRDPKNVVALGNLAAIEMEEGKLDEAERHLQAALTQFPDDAYNLSRFGFLKFQQKKYDDALNALSRAAKLDPQNPEIQNYLGVTLGHQGLRVQAETALRKAIQIDPNYAGAHNNLAVIYLSQQPPLVQLARWHYQKALDAGQARNPALENALDAAAAPPNP